MCAMLLADLGATVLRIDRKQPAELGIKRPLQYNLLLRSRHDDRAGPEGSAARRDRAAADRARRCADRRLSSRRHRAHWGSVPTSCLARNPRLVYGRMTGWGQNGPLAQDGRARHQLHRDHRCAERDRSRRISRLTCRSISSATMPAARCTWHSACSPRSCEARAVRPRPGRRCRDRRRHRLARDDVLRHACGRHVAPERGSNLTDSRLAFLRRVRMRGRRLARGRPDRGQVLRGVPADARDRPRSARRRRTTRASTGPGQGACSARKFRRAAARSTGPALFAAHRRLRRAGARLGRSAPARAPGGARHVRRGRRHRAACAGAALQRARRRATPDAARAGHSREHACRAGASGCRRDEIEDCAARGLIDRTDDRALTEDAMDLRLTDDELSFRDEVREFFRTALPRRHPRKMRARAAPLEGRTEALAEASSTTRAGRRRRGRPSGAAPAGVRSSSTSSRKSCTWRRRPSRCRSTST